jgi:hypothetical protein
VSPRYFNGRRFIPKRRCRVIGCRKDTRRMVQIGDLRIHVCKLHKSVRCEDLKPHLPPSEAP